MFGFFESPTDTEIMKDEQTAEEIVRERIKNAGSNFHLPRVGSYGNPYERKSNTPTLREVEVRYECSCGWSGPRLATWKWENKPGLLFCGGCKESSLPNA